MDTQVLPQLHKIASVSARTDLSRSAIYKQIKDGNLKTVKIGKSIRITEDALQTFIASLK
jgi:excisionase family DNA binding protein